MKAAFVPESNGFFLSSSVGARTNDCGGAGRGRPGQRRLLGRSAGGRRAGLAEADAGRRVDLIYAQARQAAQEARAAADAARLAAAKSALWMFVALLLGAFVAALCATFGGRQRERAHGHA